MSTQTLPQQTDKQESFFLAETLKYMWLLFQDDDVVPPRIQRTLGVRIGRHWSCERKLLGSAGTGTERSPGNGELVLGPSALSLEGVWSPG